MWNDDPRQRLAELVAELGSAPDLETVQRLVSRGARDVVGADGAAFVLRDGDQCAYLDEDAIAPLWKGRRFPLEACISGWVMEHQRAAVIQDIFADDRIPHEIYRPTFVRSAAVVPMPSQAPVGAIAVYWARSYEADADELAMLGELADAAAGAVAATA